MMSRYKKIGWFGESHRHYLAAKGIKTKKYFVDTAFGRFARDVGVAAHADNLRSKKDEVRRRQNIADTASEFGKKRLVQARQEARAPSLRGLNPEQVEKALATGLTPDELIMRDDVLAGVGVGVEGARTNMARSVEFTELEGGWKQEELAEQQKRQNIRGTAIKSQLVDAEQAYAKAGNDRDVELANLAVKTMEPEEREKLEKDLNEAYVNAKQNFFKVTTDEQDAVKNLKAVDDQVHMYNNIMRKFKDGGVERVNTTKERQAMGRAVIDHEKMEDAKNKGIVVNLGQVEGL